MQQEILSSVVNGGVVLLPTKEQWEQLYVSPELEKVLVGIPNKLHLHLAFTQQHPQFHLGLYRPSPVFRWLGIMIMEYASSSTHQHLQRVHIQGFICGTCKYQGLLATPTLYDLYYGTDEPLKRYNEAFDLLTVDCPSCGQHLPNHPLWCNSPDTLIVLPPSFG